MNINMECDMNMKKGKWILASIFSAYIAGFFLWAPVYMAGASLGWPWLNRAANNYDLFANRSWVSKLSHDNLILHVKYSNTIFWCNRFANCRVE